MGSIGIICASDTELAPFLPHIEHQTTGEKAMLRFYCGRIHNQSVVALYSGVCKVNGAIAAQLLIDTYQVDAIINAGVAGGIDENVRLFDTVISTQVAYHDVADEILTEFHPWMPSIYFPADENLLRVARSIHLEHEAIHFGRMVTGEKFITNHYRDEIGKKYAPLSVDMESASIAHVCYVNKVPFISIRSISDTAAQPGVEQFEDNCAQASMLAKDVTLALLAQIPGGVWFGK